MFDSGCALPARQVQSLFIIMSGKSYPAYFIRTLAHRLATGEEKRSRSRVDKMATLSFFKSLGVEIQHTPAQYIRIPSTKN